MSFTIDWLWSELSDGWGDPSAPGARGVCLRSRHFGLAAEQARGGKNWSDGHHHARNGGFYTQKDFECVWFWITVTDWCLNIDFFFYLFIFSVRSLLPLCLLSSGFLQNSWVSESPCSRKGWSFVLAYKLSITFLFAYWSSRIFLFFFLRCFSNPERLISATFSNSFRQKTNPTSDKNKIYLLYSH